jgi:hypothetical protein
MNEEEVVIDFFRNEGIFEGEMSFKQTKSK